MYVKCLEKYMVLNKHHRSVSYFLLLPFSPTIIIIILNGAKTQNVSVYAKSTFVEPIWKRIMWANETVQHQNHNLVKLRASYKFLVVKGK